MTGNQRLAIYSLLCTFGMGLALGALIVLALT